MKTILTVTLALLFSLSISAQQSSTPTFAALAMDGQKVDLATLRGKIVVLNLWFVNCPNCVEEIKQLNQIVEAYKANKDVVFLGLAASPKPVLDTFLKKNPFEYTIIPNAEMIILSKFGTPDKNGDIDIPFPMHYVLDRNGAVVYKAQGVKGIDGLKTTVASQVAKK